MDAETQELECKGTEKMVDRSSNSNIFCLHQIFESQADQTPHAPALQYGEEVFSYGELDKSANQFASMLRAEGVGPGKLVGLYCDRSADAIIAMLGVLKSGAGYVPIDPAFPEERIAYILKVAEIDILLVSTNLKKQAEKFCLNKLIDLENRQQLSKFSPTRIPVNEVCVDPTDLCYVIFTSGTTGKPKGVMTEHINAVEFIWSFHAECGLTPQDRVLQAFSLGFDGSVEEIWMAFSSGALLVVCPPEVTRMGDELARVMNENRVTFYSTVPTSLSMIRQDLPSVRILVVSGEPCPPELIDQWAVGGRRMLNVYGPTETTVNATIAECIPGRPVTIGKPLRGYEFYLMSKDYLPVPEGQAGELFIGGVGLARGYMAEPELTAKNFKKVIFEKNQPPKRLYRTGDLVQWGDNGELLFLGRIDTQVKIRGYRIELAEIESVLLGYPGIHSAIVNVHENDGVKELAAYVTVEKETDQSFKQELRGFLDERLPAYMIPRYLDILEEIPKLTSGKADRSKLPLPVCPLHRCNEDIMVAESEIEKNIAAEWQQIFGIDTVSMNDNFFTDLGGYSLMAAQMVSGLRRKHGYEVALREVYEHPTIKCLSQNVESSINLKTSKQEQASPEAGSPSAKEVFEASSPLKRWLATVFQAISLYGLYGMGVLPTTLSCLLYFFVRGDLITLKTAISLGLIVFFGYFPAMLLLSIAIKWLVIGRYKEGEYSIWSFYYFRWWLVTRFQALAGIAILEGTPLLNLYFKLMGARVGNRCVLDTALCAAFDLIEIGDDSCIGNETQMTGYRVENGMLKIGKIAIGERCFVGIHSYLGLNVSLENDACLGDLSSLQDDTIVQSGLSFSGSPARVTDVQLPDISSPSSSLNLSTCLLGAMQFVVVYGLQIFVLLTSIPSLLLLGYAFLKGSVFLKMISVLSAGPLAFLLFCLGIPLVKKLILNKVNPGVYSVNSWFYLRKWTIDSFTRMSRRLALPIYTTIYFPTWLRMLGAKIGPHAEIATVSQISPDLMEISEGSFFADGSIIGGRHFYRGHMEIAKSRVGNRSFIGNSAILPIGADVGDECLIGCLSTPPPNRETPKGSEWLGSPAFTLPFRKKVEGFDEHLTFRPTRKLIFQRCLVDLLRILLPLWIMMASGVGFILCSSWIYNALGLWMFLSMSSLVSLAMALFSALAVVVVKKVCMGTFVPIVKPLWSPFVWLNEAVNGAYESVMAPMLNPLLGTPYAAFFLRLLGCKVGKHVFLETTLFSEFDLVEIGDHCSVNLGAIIQNHLFEDRIMKASRIKIHDQANIGNMAVVLYDSEMNIKSSLAPLSLLMKGETLPEGTCSGGIPTSQNSIS
jgi:non-ribosomal peptide synthetase-like protein